MSQSGFLSQTGASDVVGPASSTDNALARFDGTSGKVIQNSVGILSDAGALSGLTLLDVDNIRVDGNTVSSTDTNGDLNFVPNGTGNTATKNPFFNGTMQYDGIAAGYASSQLQWKQDGVQTTNATVTDLVSIALAQGELVVLQASIGGFQSDFSDAISGWVRVGARRGTGGNVTIVGVPIIEISESDANTDITVLADTAGQNLKIQITGVAAQTWNWVGSYSYHKVLTNA